MKAHALVGLNQLLLGGTPAGRAAGAALAQRLAPSPAFQKSENRTGLVVNLAGLLGQPAAATRIAGAGTSRTEYISYVDVHRQHPESISMTSTCALWLLVCRQLPPNCTGFYLARRQASANCHTPVHAEIYTYVVSLHLLRRLHA